MKLDSHAIVRSLKKLLRLVGRLVVITLVAIGSLTAAGLAIKYFRGDLNSPSNPSSTQAVQPMAQEPSRAVSAGSTAGASDQPPRQRDPVGDDCNASLDSAVQDCTQKIKYGGGTAAVYLARAQAYIDRAEYQKALADCNDALRTETRLIDAILLRGAAQQYMGDYQSALHDYADALRIAPNDVEALAKRGSVLGAMGKLDDALTDLNRAIDIGARQPASIARSYYNRGLVWNIRGDSAKAVEDFQKALTANPADPNRRLAIIPSIKEKTISDQAAILYKDVKFSPDRTTSDWRQIVMDVMPTRFGDLVMTRMLDEASTSTILLNGAEISRTPVLATVVFDVYQVGATDVVLVGVNAGGSPELSLSFLILKAPDKTAAVWDKDFNADSFDSVQTTVKEDGRVLVSFGCRNGRRYAGILAGEKLVVRAMTSEDDPMAELECEEKPKGGPGVFN